MNVFFCSAGDPSGTTVHSTLEADEQRTAVEAWVSMDIFDGRRRQHPVELLQKEGFSWTVEHIRVCLLL